MKAWVGLLAFLVMCSPAYAYSINGQTVTYSGAYGSVSQTPYLLTSPVSYPIINFTSGFSTTQSLDIAFGFNTPRVTPTKAEWYNPHTEEKSYTCNGYFNYTVSPNYFWCWENITMVGGSGTLNTQGLVFSHSFDTGNLTSKTAYWTETVDWTDISDLFTQVSYDFDGKNTWYVISGVTFDPGETKTIRPTITAQAYTDTKYDIMIKRHSDSWASAISSSNYVLLDPWVNVTETLSIATLTGSAGLGANQATGAQYTVLRNHTLWNFTIGDLAGTMNSAWIFDSSFHAIHTCSVAGHIMTCNYDFILNSANTSDNIYYPMVGWNSSQNLAYLSSSTNYTGNNSKFVLGNNLYCNPGCSAGSGQYNMIQNVTTSYLNDTGGASSTTTTLWLNGTSANATGSYGLTVNATANSSIAGLYVELYRNGTLINNATTKAFNITLTGAGVWNYTAKTIGNASYTASTVTYWFNISKASNPLVLTNNTSLSGVYPYPISFTGSGNNTAATLYKNGTSVSNPYNVLLGAGGYNFSWNTSGNANYSANQTSSILSITQGKSIISLCADATCLNTISGGIATSTSQATATYPNGLTIVAGGGYGPYNLQISYWNAGVSTYVFNATNNTVNYFNATTGNKLWEVKYNVTGNANYSANYSAIPINISQGTPAINITFNVSSPIIQGTPYIAQCSKPAELTASFYNDTGSAANPLTVITSVISGTFNYTCNTTGNGNYTSATATPRQMTVALSGSFIIAAVYDENNVSSSLTFDLEIFNSTFSSSQAGVTSYTSNSIGGDVTVVISSTGYGTRRYYASIPPAGIYNMTGYLVATADGQNVQFTIKDYYDLLIDGATMTFERLVPAWSNVSMAQSDSSGKAVVFLDPQASYRITIVKSGYPTKVLSLTPVLTSYVIYLSSASVSAPNYWDYYSSTTASCNFVNATRNLGCTWSNSSANLTSMTLTVIKAQSNGTSYSLCSNTSANLTGTFSCAFGVPQNSTFTWQMSAGFSDGTTFSVASGSWTDASAAASMGLMGLLLAFMLVMLTGMVGVSMKSPVLTVVMVLLGVGASFMMGFVELSGGMVAMFIGLAVAGGILIFKMR